jgi:hypothetical protein
LRVDSRGRSTTTVHRRERRGSGSTVPQRINSTGYATTGGREEAREDGKGGSRGRKDLVHTDAATWMTGGREEAPDLRFGGSSTGDATTTTE